MRRGTSSFVGVARSTAGARALFAVAIIAGVTLAVVPIATAAYAAGGWYAPTRIDHHNRLTSVSCSSPTFCAAVDTLGNAVTYNGTRWSPPATVDPGKAFSSASSVSCPSATFCVAVDSSGHALIYNGTSWSAPTNIDNSDSVPSVSCPSASFCVAVDFNGNALTYNGTSWSGPTNIDNSDSFASVSCPSASFCVAVDFNGNALTYNGTSWSGPTNVVSDPLGGLTSVSCSSASFCAATNTYGFVATYNGSTWSAPTDINPIGYHSGGLGPVSCTSPSFCIAGDDLAVNLQGYVQTYNGSTWSAPTDADRAGTMASVSCPEASFCAAVDFRGHAVTYGGLVITTASLPGGTAGVTYSASLSATGGNAPYTWRVAKGSKLPRGLKLRSSTGVISGKPDAAGTSTFTAQVADTKTTMAPHEHTTNTKVFTVTIS